MEMTKVKDIMELSRKYVTNEEIAEIEEKYRIAPDDPHRITPGWHKVIVGEAARLLQTVMEKGGNEDEVRLAVLYSIICIDAEKRLIEYKRFKQENGVVELSKKYGVVTH